MVYCDEMLRNHDAQYDVTIRRWELTRFDWRRKNKAPQEDSQGQFGYLPRRLCGMLSIPSADAGGRRLRASTFQQWCSQRQQDERECAWFGHGCTTERRPAT